MLPSANRVTLGLFFLGVLAFTSASCRDSSSLVHGGSASVQVQPMSFAEFRKFQEDYCQSVADFLNTPIDWHVVLDISGSYVTAEEPIPKALVPLVSSLPLEQGDWLTVDTFSEDYYEGRHLEVTTEWIQTVKDGGIAARNEIENSLAPLESNPAYPGNRTDIENLFTGSSPRVDEHRICDSRKEKSCDSHSEASQRAHKYYVILTDGMHEPEGEGKLKLLFRDSQGADTGFLKVLFGFVHQEPEKPFRALFLVVDPGSIKRLQSRNSVLRDWRYGLRQIAEKKKGGGGGAGAALLNGALWDSTDPNLFTDEIRRRIGRKSGVYPCLVTGLNPAGGSVWYSGHWPTVTSYPYPTLQAPSSPIGPYYLEIPADAVHEERETEYLPLFLLTSDTKSRHLSVTIAEGRLSAKGEPLIHEPRIEPVEPEDESSSTEWKSMPHLIPIKLTEDVLTEFSFPWTMEGNFANQKDRIPFIRVELMSPQTDIREAFTIWWKKLFFHGRIFALVALFLLAFSLLTAWLYAEHVKFSVRVFYYRPDGAMEDAKREGSAEVYAKRHFRYIDNDPQVKEVLREDGPSMHWLTDKTRRIFFDVIPIFGVVYHLVYYRDIEKDCFDSRGKCLQLGFRKMDDDDEIIKETVGLLYKPDTFWRPSSFPLRRCAHEWRATISGLSTPAGEPKQEKRFHVITKIAAETWTLWSLRLSSTLLSSFAFASSVAAIAQSFSWQNNILWDGNKLVWCLFALAVIFSGLLYALRGRVGSLRKKEDLVPQAQSSMPPWGLWVDTGWTFLLYISLALAIFSSFFAKGVSKRWTVIAIAFLGFLFVIPLYEKIRDQIVKSRISSRQPVSVLDFLGEVFLARLCS